jgi:hypothetical protein
VKLNGPVDHRWIKIEKLDVYPFPKANHKFFPALKEFIGNPAKGDKTGPGTARDDLRLKI